MEGAKHVLAGVAGTVGKSNTNLDILPCLRASML
jgi:hypothetical protein